MIHMGLPAPPCHNRSVIQRRNLYPLPSLNVLSFCRLCAGPWPPGDSVWTAWQVGFTHRLVLGLAGAFQGTQDLAIRSRKGGEGMGG